LRGALTLLKRQYAHGHDANQVFARPAVAFASVRFLLIRLLAACRVRLQQAQPFTCRKLQCKTVESYM